MTTVTILPRTRFVTNTAGVTTDLHNSTAPKTRFVATTTVITDLKK